jgi:hypothetical protein
VKVPRGGNPRRQFPSVYRSAQVERRQEIIATGSLTDEQLGAMDFYVEGVVGKVPAGGK